MVESTHSNSFPICVPRTSPQNRSRVGITIQNRFPILTNVNAKNKLVQTEARLFCLVSITYFLSATNYCIWHFLFSGLTPLSIYSKRLFKLRLLLCRSSGEMFRGITGCSSGSSLSPAIFFLKIDLSWTSTGFIRPSLGSVVLHSEHLFQPWVFRVSCRLSIFFASLTVQLITKCQPSLCHTGGNFSILSYGSRFGVYIN